MKMVDRGVRAEMIPQGTRGSSSTRGKTTTAVLVKLRGVGGGGGGSDGGSAQFLARIASFAFRMCFMYACFIWNPPRGPDFYSTT